MNKKKNNIKYTVFSVYLNRTDKQTKCNESEKDRMMKIYGIKRYKKTVRAIKLNYQAKYCGKENDTHIRSYMR